MREAIFDILGSRGGVVGLSVVDLFCGSGALGIEALSRGAASVTLVERDPEVLAAAGRNLEAVGLGDAPARLVQGTLPGWLDGAGHFDLALCDPPYAFDAWGPLLARLDADEVVIESAGDVALPSGWHAARVRRYGSTLVTVAVHDDPQAPLLEEAGTSAHGGAARS